MKILFNEQPKISYALDSSNHKEDLESGYASHVESKDDATIICFKNVEDHIDGNGLSLLWLVQGYGDFFLEGEKISLKLGDAILFDDNKEHGFDSEVLCVAVTFVINPTHDMEYFKSRIINFNSDNTNKKKLKI